MKMVFWSWFVGVMSFQFWLWKRRVLLHSLCNSREVLRWIRSRRSGKMSGRSCLTFLHMKMLLIFCQIDESDKWTVAVLHELLHILVPKKTDRDNLLLLGEYLGLRSRFKRALLQHPGIFYMSTKIGTYTVVLKEGYKRGLLVEDHPWMQMRNRYIHLMNMVKEDGKPVSVLGGNNEKKSEGALSDSSDAEVESASDDEHDDDEDENKSRKGVRKNVAANRGRKARKMNLDVKGLSRKSEYDDDEDGNKSQRGVRKNVADNRGRKDWKMNSNVKGPSRKSEIEREAGKRPRNSKEEFPSRTKMHDGNNVLVSSRERSSVPKCRGRLLPGKRTSTS